MAHSAIGLRLLTSARGPAADRSVAGIRAVGTVYQRHEFLAERQAALDLWGAHVSQPLGEISHDRRMDLKIVA
jgi:hypothetical protein